MPTSSIASASPSGASTPSPPASQHLPSHRLPRHRLPHLRTLCAAPAFPLRLRLLRAAPTRRGPLPRLPEPAPRARSVRATVTTEADHRSAGPGPPLPTRAPPPPGARPRVLLLRPARPHTLLLSPGHAHAVPAAPAPLRPPAVRSYSAWHGHARSSSALATRTPSRPLPGLAVSRPDELLRRQRRAAAAPDARARAGR
nr:extensin-like [Aegilops tauschii subsp. strangulata]